MLVVAPALVEAYSVLTRLPPALRLNGADAMAVLDGSFTSRGEVVALDAAGYLELLRGAPARGMVGGRLYDAIIAACAVRAGAATVLIFNVHHFRPLLPSAVEVVAPAVP